MIESKLQQSLKAFQEKWKPRLSSVPTLTLDQSWPSVGTIDLLSFTGRLKSDLHPQEDILLRGCSLYLAQVVQSCWNTIAKDTSIILEDGFVTITARGGEFLPEDGELRLPLEKVFRETLRSLPDPLPVLRNIERRISFDSNIVSPMTIGMCTGLSPFVDGPWNQLSFKDLKTPLQQISRELAKQSAAHYAAIYPDEPLGAVAELYLSALVFPPLMVGEDLPGVEAVRQVAEFCKKYSVTSKQLNALAHNWALLSDDTISHVGLVLYAATCDTQPAPQIVAAAQSKANFVGLLRQALCEARKLLSKEEELTSDWVVTGIEHPVHEQHFRVEEELLFMPWLILPMEYCRARTEYQPIQEMLLAICAYEFDETLRLCDKLIELEPSDIYLRLQRIKLEMVRTDFEAADTMFRSLLSETGADTNPMLFHLWSLNEMARSKPESASKYCRAGLAVVETDSRLYPELQNNLGWVLLLQGKGPEALECFSLAASTMLSPVTPLLNQSHLLWRMEQKQEAEAIRSKLAQLAPFDRRVFASIAAGNIS